MSSGYITSNANPPRREAARYTEQLIPSYRGNPLIEALPPIIDDRSGIEKRLNRPIAVTPEQRGWSSGVRYHLVASISNQYMYPLDRDVAFFSNFSEILRGAYIGRNPNDPDYGWNAPDYEEKFKETINRVAVTSHKFGAISCLSVLGHSGLGKTKMVEEVASHYPQVITHKNLLGPFSTLSQVVWLKLSVPPDGSLRGLCIAVVNEFDRLLGTDYRNEFARPRSTVDTLIADIARLACQHGVGVLIVDEIHNLLQTSFDGGEKVLNFLKQLGDVTRISVIAVGTELAEKALGKDFQNSRRYTRCHKLVSLEKREFLYFARGLSDGVVLQNNDLPEEEFFEYLWDATLGIHDLVVKLFCFTQQLALHLGQEKLTLDLLRQAYKKDLKLVIPHLDYMRRVRDEAAASGFLIQPAAASTDETVPETVTATVRTQRKRRRSQKAKIDASDPNYVFLASDLTAEEVVNRLRSQGHLTDLSPNSSTA